MNPLNACFSPLSLVIAFFRPAHLDPICAAVLFEQTHPAYVRLARYLIYFSATCVLEAPFYWVASAGRQTLTTGRRVAQIIILNLATHPAVTWLFPAIFSAMNRPYRDTLFFSESFAWIVEALILRFAYKYEPARAVVASISANLFSWWAGLYLIEALRLS